MPLYDCGDPDCDECQRTFGPDRSKAIEQSNQRAIFYAGLNNDEQTASKKPGPCERARTIVEGHEAQYGQIPMSQKLIEEIAVTIGFIELVHLEK